MFIVLESEIITLILSQNYDSNILRQFNFDYTIYNLGEQESAVA